MNSHLSYGIRRWLVVGVVALLALLASPVSAYADSDDDSVTRWDVHAEVGADGSVAVTIDFDFDFGRDEGHGPVVALPERMRIPDDPDHWRMLPISDIAASSETAPADVEIDRDDGAVLIRIGDPDVEIEGSHTYRLSYRMEGVINPGATGSGLDEFNWNALGTVSEIPVHRVSVTVDTPAAVERVACFSGERYDQPCEATSSGSSATFGVDLLQPGEGIQVVAGMPFGTFDGADPILAERYHASRVLGVNPASLSVAGVVLVGGAAGTVGLLRRRGDRAFADVEPGTIPDGEGQTRQTRATGVVPVRDVPPQYVSPGLVGVLDDLVADQKDVLAAMVDLAVRGHLRFEEHAIEDDTDEDAASEGDTGDKDMGESVRPHWAVRTEPPAGAMLRTHEQVLLDTLFADGDRVDLTQSGALTATVGAAQKAMYAEATDELGWFNGNPSTIRTRWVITGLLTVAVGIALIFALGMTVRLGFVGIAVAVVGLVIAIGSAWAPGRTALGTAVWTQAQGFKKYLDQVTADQVTVEPGVDLWSSYLPWAMLWGSTTQWTNVFATQSAQGVTVPIPIWYVGLTPWSWHSDVDSIVGSVDALSTATTTAMSVASSSSAGATGFAGGGGVGGGGVGGW